MEQLQSNEDGVEAHIIKRFVFHKKLGKGAYGVVYKATDKKTKEVVALKKLFGAFRNDTDAQRTFREVMILQELNGHSNIIRLLNVIKAENQVDLYLVFEHMEADLYQIIRTGILQPIHKICITYQIVKALKYIHSADVIHRDLKPCNVFINSDCLVKLGDFGLARTLQNLDRGFGGVVTDYVATRWYRAPEMLMGSHRYTQAIDMWSVGCILFELLSARPLFPGKSTKHMFALVLEATGLPEKEEYDSIKRKYGLALEYHMLEKVEPKGVKQILAPYCRDPLAVDFLMRLLVFNPDKRMTAQEALEHEFLSKFHDEEQEIACERKITVPLDDTKKFSLQDYRKKLYEEVLKRKKEIRRRLIETIKKNKI